MSACKVATLPPTGTSCGMVGGGGGQPIAEMGKTGVCTEDEREHSAAAIIDGTKCIALAPDQGVRPAGVHRHSVIAGLVSDGEAWDEHAPTPAAGRPSAWRHRSLRDAGIPDWRDRRSEHLTVSGGQALAPRTTGRRGDATRTSVRWPGAPPSVGPTRRPRWRRVRRSCPLTLRGRSPSWASSWAMRPSRSGSWGWSLGPWLPRGLLRVPAPPAPSTSDRSQSGPVERRGERMVASTSALDGPSPSGHGAPGSWPKSTWKAS